MFDIGWSELLVIAVVAIIFIGPRELIPMLRTFGRYAGKLKRMAADFQSQFNEALREVELDQINKDVEEMRSISPLKDIKDEVEKEMKPVTGPASDASKPSKTSPARGSEPVTADTAAEPARSKAAAKPVPAKSKAAAKPEAAAGEGGEPKPSGAPKPRDGGADAASGRNPGGA